jgi:hypothetical protein
MAMLDGLRIPARDDRTRPMADLAGRFRFNTTLVDLLVDGLAGEDWTRREGNASPAIWVLGHLAAMRLYLLRTLEVRVPRRDWEERFAAGSDPTSNRDSHPSPETLLECLRRSDRALVKVLTELSSQEVDAVWASDGPDEVSLGGCVGFFYFDETFHLGQLGLIRQMLGKRPVL